MTTADDDEDDTALRGRVTKARPELDATVRAVMRANAARALFGASPLIQIGRYELQREIGTGGGGTVFLARDPELRRDVAVKLIATPDGALRERAFAEGQALARLAHPNVVSVFDVGIVDDRVYLVMELVRGDSLRTLANRARARDVVLGYRQAGEGLVAAHDAGLMHRDFKPDNAVIAGDGRVRVVDFGLAGALGDETTGGTESYLAPEARDGAAAKPEIDQYAFAVALAEGVTRANGSLPRWLEPIVRRGSNPDPAARFPSMRELLKALARDPRTRWTRRALVATPLALAVVGFAVGRSGDSTPACDDGVALLAPAWTPARERAALDRVLGLGTPFAKLSAPRVREKLAGYAAQWITSRNAACVAARTEPSAAVIDRQSTCLASARNQLATAIDMVTSIEPSALSDAMRALSELPSLERCADPEALASDVAQPTPAQRPRVDQIRAAIDRAQVLADAARPDAIPAAAAAVAEARALGYQPLLASALLVHGRALYAVGQPAASLAPFVEAVEIAIVERDDRIAVEAFARSMLVKMGKSRPPLILAELRPILVLAKRLGPRDRFAAALLHNHAGVVELADGHPDLARAEQTKALELARGVTGPGAVDLAWVRTNLALIADDPGERERFNDEAVAVAREHLGADHPMTLTLAIMAAFGRSDRNAAHAAFTRLVELHPNQRSTIAEFGYQIAILELGGGDRDRALSTFVIMLAAATDLDTKHVAIARAYKQFLDGSDATGAELAKLATTPEPDAPWYAFLVPADVELGRAIAAPDPATRIAAAKRAVGYLERASAGRSQFVAHRLAWARSLTARAPAPTSP